MLDSKSVLSKYGISKTIFRIHLLDLFSKSKRSFSVESLLQIFSDSVNKATIYRALNDFEDKGLIHKVPDLHGLQKYALCRAQECSVSSHNHNHGHFVCFNCNQTFCLDEMRLPEITCLKGFYIENLKLTAEGYCQDCYKD